MLKQSSGLCDILERHILKSMSFCIALDDKTPWMVTECYKFSVTYKTDEDSILLDEEYLENLRSVLRRFIAFTQKLSMLPEPRFLFMKMVYYDSCPIDNTLVDHTPLRPENTYPSFHEFFLPGSIPELQSSNQSFSASDSMPNTFDDNMNSQSSLYSSVSAEFRSHNIGNLQRDVTSQRSTVIDYESSFCKHCGTLELPSYSISVDIQIASQNKPAELETEATKSLTSIIPALEQINCECGHQKEEFDSHMIQCYSCKGWFHPHCYGYESSISSTYFLCYSCMILDDDKLLDKMKRLMKTRKAIKYVLDTKIKPMSKTNINRIRRDLGFQDSEITIMIVELLSAKVYSLSKHRDRSFLRLNSGKGTRKRIKREYFDPQAHIKIYTSKEYPYSDVPLALQWHNPTELNSGIYDTTEDESD